jgi:hypothetical protein
MSPVSRSRFKIQDLVHEWDIDDDEQWLQQVEPHTTSAELNEVTVAFDVDARTLGFQWRVQCFADLQQVEPHTTSAELNEVTGLQWRVQCFADPGSDRSRSINAPRIFCTSALKP